MVILYGYVSNRVGSRKSGLIGAGGGGVGGANNPGPRYTRVEAVSRIYTYDVAYSSYMGLVGNMKRP